MKYLAITWGLALGALSAWFVWHATLASESAKEEYHQLVSLLIDTPVSKNVSVLQGRKGVVKQVLFLQEGQRLEGILKAPFSEVRWEIKDSAWWLEETLQNPQGIVQEAIHEEAIRPYQVVRVFDAKHALIDYRDETIRADDVEVAREEWWGVVPSFEAEKKEVLFLGEAKQIEWRMNDSKGPRFKAVQLKAKTGGWKDG